MVELRAASGSDIAHVGSQLRAADLAEIQAAHGTGVDPQRIVLQAARASDLALAAIAHDGEPIALLGVAPISLVSGEGAPWMLGTERVFQEPRAALLLGRRMTTAWAERYRLLQNWVDARNALSIRWLRKIGFTIHPAEPHGALGLPFHRFTRVHLMAGASPNIP